MNPATRWPLALLLLSLMGCRKDPVEKVSSTIVVSGDVEHSVVHEFTRSKGRQPTREELLAMHRVWIDNEVLYREGLKRDPSQRDPSQRERIIFASLMAIDENLRRAPVSEAELQRWFATHRGMYEQPAKLDFEDATAPSGTTEATLRARVDALNHQAPQQAQLGIRTFQGRPLNSVVQIYGQAAADALAAAPLGQWQLIRSRDTWRAMRVLAKTPATTANFEALRDTLRRDLGAANSSEQRSAAVHALWDHYRIVFEAKHDCLADNQ